MVWPTLGSRTAKEQNRVTYRQLTSNVSTHRLRSTDTATCVVRRWNNVSVTGVLQLLDHVCGTCCQFIYGCVTVLNSLNGCWRPICLVFETAALCDALVRSDVYKLSYLLTYLFTLNVSSPIANILEVISSGGTFVFLLPRTHHLR